MKTIDAEALERALTKCINHWMNIRTLAPDGLAQSTATALTDVRQCVREAAGINKGLNED